MPYGVRVLKCVKKLKASLEIKLVNIKLCKCSWYVLNVVCDLAYGVNEGLSRAERMFQVQSVEDMTACPVSHAGIAKIDQLAEKLRQRGFQRLY